MKENELLDAIRALASSELGPKGGIYPHRTAMRQFGELLAEAKARYPGRVDLRALSAAWLLGVTKEDMADRIKRLLVAVELASKSTGSREEKMPSMFVCHSSKDKFFVRELAAKLCDAGIRVWLDEAEIKIGDSLTRKIGEAIDSMDYFGVVLSRHSVASEWVQRELEVAMQRELREHEVVVLPLLLEPVELPPFLRDKLYADFTTPEHFTETFPKLLEALGARAQAPIPEPPEELLHLTPPLQSPAERRLSEFEDISIVDLDLGKSYNPDDQHALYNMYLRLSRTPPEEWQQIFDAERRFPRHTMWRRAWIEGSYIVIYCVPEELEKYHLRDLREDTKNCNAKYRQYLTESAQREAREQQRVKAQRDELRELKNRLGFD